MGRPTSYKQEYDAQVEKLCRLGATDPEIADFFGVAVATLYNWREQFPTFLEALKAGKQTADAEVADKLYRRATGYNHPAVKIFLRRDDDAPVHAPYTEHCPPDVTACIFWLKNRRPDLWRDKHEIETKTKVEHQVNLAALSNDQLATLVDIIGEAEAVSAERPKVN